MLWVCHSLEVAAGQDWAPWVAWSPLTAPCLWVQGCSGHFSRGPRSPTRVQLRSNSPKFPELSWRSPLCPGKWAASGRSFVWCLLGLLNDFLLGTGCAGSLWLLLRMPLP